MKISLRLKRVFRLCRRVSHLARIIEFRKLGMGFHECSWRNLKPYWSQSAPFLISAAILSHYFHMNNRNSQLNSRRRAIQPLALVDSNPRDIYRKQRQTPCDENKKLQIRSETISNYNNRGKITTRKCEWKFISKLFLRVFIMLVQLCDPRRKKRERE